MARGRQSVLQSRAARSRADHSELIRWGLLILVPLLAFAPLFHAEFTTWDDYDTVAKNPAMLAPTPEVAGEFWTNLASPSGDLYIPVTQTIWSLLAQGARLEAPDASGISLSAAPFHAASICFHMLSVLLVYLILRQLIPHAWPAALGALLFAVHPVQVETVAWVSGLKDVLGGMFCLGSLYAFVKFVRGDGNQKWLWYGAGFVSFVLSMLSKPAGVVTPILAIVLGWAVIYLVGSGVPIVSASSQRAVRIANPTKRRQMRAVLLALIPWFLATLPIIWEGHRVQPAPLVERLPFWLRPLIAGDSLAFYLRQLLFPLHLAPDYGRLPALVIHGANIDWIWMIPAGVLIAAILLGKRIPLLPAAVLLFFLAPLPVLGFIPFEFQIYSTAADHYQYIAMLGAAMLAGALLDRFWSRWLWAAASLILLALAARTFLQAAYWQNTMTLFEHTLEVNPNSYVSHAQLGMVLAAQGKDQQAAAHDAAAVKLKPDDFKSNFNWANLLLRQGNPQAAAEHYAIALKTAPHNISLLNNYGVTLARLGRLPDAAGEFDAVLREDPTNAEAVKNLAKVQSMSKARRE